MNTHPLMSLKIVRETLGVKASALADRLGCTMTTFYRYEAGKRRAYLDQGHALAQLLGVDIAMLARELTIDDRVELLKEAEKRKAAAADPAGEAAWGGMAHAFDGGAPPALVNAIESDAIDLEPDPEPAPEPHDDLEQVLRDWGSQDE